MIKKASFLVPLAPFTVSLIIGIVVGDSLHPQGLLPVLAGAVAAALLTARWPRVQSALLCLCFVVLGMMTVQRQTPSDKVRQTAVEWREQLLNRYHDVNQGGENDYAVLAAMTLGDKSALTKEVKETYSVTGASHILALSGLHLGIIYMLLTTLLAGRRRFWLSQMVIILSIWAFAFLTGLSVSIIRSATMISIYALFSIGGRQRSSVNLLCLAALVMLLYNGRLLFDIGFQMSFMAVLSILLLRPLAERMVTPEYIMDHRVLSWLWGVVWVSVAAQIGVAPLIAYYFGRFSTYFLLTNMMVLPLATLILYGAIAFLITSWGFVGQVLFWLVGLLNHGLTAIARLPMASIDGLHPSVLQICMVYVMLVCTCLLLYKLIPKTR